MTLFLYYLKNRRKNDMEDCCKASRILYDNKEFFRAETSEVMVALHGGMCGN